MYPELKVSEQFKVIKVIKNFLMSKLIKSINGIKIMKVEFFWIKEDFYELYNKKNF